MLCGADCSALPRVKDAAGRYCCKACHDAALAAAKAAQAPQTAPSESDTYDIDDDNALLAAVAHSQAPALRAAFGPSGPCPKCRAYLSSEMQICFNCGYDRLTGKVRKQKPSPRTEEEKQAAARHQSQTTSDWDDTFLQSNPLAWFIGGGIGGALGAAAWAYLGSATGSYFSWMAALVGLLCGMGVHIVARRKSSQTTGLVALAITMASMVGGHTWCISLTESSSLEQIARTYRPSDSQALTALTGELAAKAEAQGRKLDWPGGQSARSASKPEDYPPDIRMQAEAAWVNADDQWRENYRTAQSEKLVAEIRAASGPARDALLNRAIGPAGIQARAYWRRISNTIAAGAVGAALAYAIGSGKGYRSLFD